MAVIRTVLYMFLYRNTCDLDWSSRKWPCSVGKTVFFWIMDPILAGGWFGTYLFSPFSWEFHHPNSQLTKSYFSEGLFHHQPDDHPWYLSLYPSYISIISHFFRMHEGLNPANGGDASRSQHNADVQRQLEVQWLSEVEATMGLGWL